MSKKRKASPPPEVREENKNPYELKTDAVERLVTADSKSYPKLTIENDPRRKYRGGALARIPSWIKALFMKFWFNGAVCFFILWGLGLYVRSMENMILILAAVLGMVTDLLVNSAFRFFATVEGENDKWMMFPKKKLINLFLNILYAFVVLIVVIWLYNVINAVINGILGNTEPITYIGVEPILFGLFYMIVDLCLISIKNMLVSIIRDAKRKNGVK